MVKNRSMKTSRKVTTVLHLGYAGPWPKFKKFATSLEEKYNEVTMECVRERIMEREILQVIDTRIINDRVHAELRNSVATPATLPTEKEQLCDRVNRLFREDMCLQHHQAVPQKPCSVQSRFKHYCVYVRI